MKSPIQSSPGSPSPSPLMRPGEKVRQYLIEGAGRGGWKVGARLPSVRRVAREVGVSTATVQTVFHRLADEGRIRSEVGNGSFWVGEDGDGAVLRVALNIPVPPAPDRTAPSDWANRIYGGILHGVLRAGRPIVLRSLPQAALDREEEKERFLKESVGMSGFILFPGEFSRRLRAMHEGEGRPVVDLNPPHDSATVNFVSPDYFSASRVIGRAFLESGRTRVAVVVCPPVEESVSVRMRCAGVAAGLGNGLGRQATMRIFDVRNRDAEAGRGFVREAFARGGFRPDAIYCAGDSLALGAIHELRERRIGVPKAVSVVGGNGLGVQDEASHFLTSMVHALDVLGSELIDMVVRRITAGGASVPGKFLPPVFHIGRSTTPEENRVLGRLAEPNER